MNTEHPMYEWKTLPWKTIEREVFKLQKRIYQASSRKEMQTVHKLQRILLSSYWAKCLAVRQVTQDNKGRKTAGIDGIKLLAPEKRLELVSELNLETKAKPLRRVWIPKPSGEKRPLGIPTIKDRAAQALLKLALEPEWEAKFEPNSYGFRPGRSCHDAIVAIHDNLRAQGKYVLDADIEKCFDQIDHESLLKKTQAPPRWRRVIKQWLKAGVMEGKSLYPTESGTPQGGVISPLLANIALHGLENHLKETFPWKSRGTWGRSTADLVKVVRYADDLVLFHPQLDRIEQAQVVLEEWLKPMGLKLKASKTQISHTLIPYQGKIGFDFLGYEVRQYPVGKTHSGKKAKGFKTIIKPSKEAQKRHARKIKSTLRQYRTASQIRLIKLLNPVITGWCHYYSKVVSKRVFSRTDKTMYEQLRSWAYRRHPNKSHGWISRKYWHHEKGKWEFRSKGRQLKQHSDTPIRRHAKVKREKSPFDGDWIYWGKRLQRYTPIPRRVGILLKKQDGKCLMCGLYFKEEDVIEIDHIIPKHAGGKDEYVNWQLLHRHCHDKKSALDGTTRTRSKRFS